MQDRPSVLRGVGSLSVAGGLAGCSGGGGGDTGTTEGGGAGTGATGTPTPRGGGDAGTTGADDAETTGADDAETTGADDAETTGGGEGTPTTGGGDGSREVSGWLSDVGNVDGTIPDRTGTDEVTVTVGADCNGPNFAFAPPAVRVDAGAAVVWEWTGLGGSTTWSRNRVRISRPTWLPGRATPTRGRSTRRGLSPTAAGPTAHWG